MEYKLDPEVIGDPSLKLDGESEEIEEINKISSILSNIVNMDQAKIAYFIKNLGINTVLNNPSLITPDEDKAAQILELKDLIMFGGANDGSDNNAKSIRYR